MGAACRRSRAGQAEGIKHDLSFKRTQGRYHCSAAAGVFQTGHRRRIQCARGSVCAGDRHHRPGQDLCRPQAAQPHQRRERPLLLGRRWPAGAVRRERRTGRGTQRPRTHDLGRDRCGQPHRPHDLQPDRLRTDRLCPSADPQGDGKAGQPLYAGGLCAGDRDAVHRLCCQHRPQHHGRRSA